LVMQLISELKARGYFLKVQDIFSTPTISELVDFIEEERSNFFGGDIAAVTTKLEEQTEEFLL
ncbi:hypothetical protein, partial [Pseudoalteromonas sp. MMG007]|uniref:hypothetical protein n=1 Tax=Pseudoalteromonas sp. MMG007 TaxID=2822684 RepID=UPI001B37741E